MAEVAPPNVSQGWEAKWSSEYNTWYYLNSYTQESAWELPKDAYNTYQGGYHPQSVLTPPETSSPPEYPTVTSASDPKYGPAYVNQYPLTPPATNDPNLQPQYPVPQPNFGGVNASPQSNQVPTTLPPAESQISRTSTVSPPSGGPVNLPSSAPPTTIESSMQALSLAPSSDSQTSMPADLNGEFVRRAPQSITEPPAEGTREMPSYQNYGPPSGYQNAQYGAAPPARTYGAQPYSSPPPGQMYSGALPALNYGSAPPAPTYGNVPPSTQDLNRIPSNASSQYAASYSQPPTGQPAPAAPQEEHKKKKGLFGKLGDVKGHMPHMPQMGTGTKVALGVGAGMLLGGAIEGAIKNSNFQIPMPNMPQMPQIQGMANMPHFQHSHHHHQHHPQHHAGDGLLGGLLGAGAGGAMAGGSSMTGGSSMGSPMAFGGPRLHILSANYGGGDVTDKVRTLVKEDQCIHLQDDGNWRVFDDTFGDHWGGNSKSLSILYQYQGRPLELLVVAQASGGVRINHRDTVRPDRRAYVTEYGPMIAVVWGIMENRMQPVPRQCVVDIASYKNFKATNDYFGFDGWTGVSKTAVVYCRDQGRIWNFAVRDGNTGKM